MVKGLSMMVKDPSALARGRIPKFSTGDGYENDGTPIPTTHEVSRVPGAMECGLGIYNFQCQLRSG